jgi:predicted O-methyltransferase YrrM
MKFWINAAWSIARNVAADVVTSDRRFDFTKQWLSSGLTYDARPRVPARHFLDLYPQSESMELNLRDLHFRRSNVTPFELYCISCIGLIRKPRRVFEIGTYDGATTLQIARTCEGAEVFTLDLAADDVPSDVPAMADELDNVRGQGVGHRFAGTPESQRIKQLFGDSTKFDYSPYNRTIDMVFVDACHFYEFAASDTRSALGLIAQGGVILWHDYQLGWPGVVRAVNEVLPNHRIFQIDSTSLAVLDPAIP